MFYAICQAKNLRLSFALALLLTFASAFANISGSIFTTLPDGTAVNHNLFADPETVYLNGGPQNLTGSGLPDGVYYFQVTTPSGALLLSNDPATDRIVRASNGRFAGRVMNDPPTYTLFPIPPPPYPPVGPPTYPHPDGPQNPANGSVPCQLWPFDLTTNQGGEYKVWLIPVDKATIDQDGVHLTFKGGDSKTDNFKIGQGTPPIQTVATLSGHKFYDSNMDGVDVLNNVPEGEVGVTNFFIHIELTDSQGQPVVLNPAPGAPIVIVGPGVYEVPTTSGGNWALPGVPTGTNYTVCEVLPAGDGHWLQTAPGVAGDPIDPGCFSRGYDGTVADVDIIDLNFGNIETGRVGGTKFYDKNMDGVQDNGELGVANVPIHIVVTQPDGSVVTEDTTTAADGSYMSSYYPDGSTYVITELLNGHWLQTYPGSNAAQTGTIGPGTPLPGQFQDYDVTYTIADTTTKGFGNIERGRLSGVKFYDTNMNGTLNNGELPISGFHITATFTDPLGKVTVENLVTAIDGSYTSDYYPDGTTYTVSEVLPATGWIQTGPSGNLYSGSINGGTGPYDFGTFTIPDITGLNFGNIATATLSGLKFYDQNGDGIQNNGDPGIQGFKIVITATYPDGSVHVQTLYTVAGGGFTSQGFPDGTTYKVVEVAPNSSWHQSAPASVFYTGTITGTGGPYTVNYTITGVTGLVFGNYRVGAGGGLTLGFWSNKNGYAKANAVGWTTVFGILNTSHLRNANGTVATWPVSAAGYKTFQSWILGANATNMANMLSAQLAAMELNVLSGGVNGSSLIYAPGTLSANAQGFATVNAIINEAIASLAVNGLTVASGPVRTYQAALKDALDRANNNLSFIQGPITIIVPSPY